MNDDFFQILSEISRKRPLDKEVWNNAEKLRQAGVMAEEQDIRDVVSFISVDSLFGNQGYRYELPKYFYNVISKLLEGNKEFFLSNVKNFKSFKNENVRSLKNYLLKKKISVRPPL